MRPVTIRVRAHRPLLPLVIVPSPVNAFEAHDMVTPFATKRGKLGGRAQSAEWQRLRAIERAAMEQPTPCPALLAALTGDAA